jgi:alpha-beta hydrolase superfamily lysophospholipase
MDFSISLKNGQFLKGIIVSPGEDTRAVIIMVHGLGEHVQRYTGWAGLFREQRVGFTGMDLPGHGRSGGRRGHIRSYSQTDEMIDVLINTCYRTFPDTPLYIYGHSLGGGLVLDYLLRKKPKVKGAIVTSPWLRLSFEPSRSKLILASAMKFIIPWLAQPSGLIVDHISHDKKIIERYKTDPLVHDRISVSLFNNAMNAAKYSLDHAAELTVPTLLIHGSDDLICSPEGSREFASKTDMVDLKIWDGGYHELHNEVFSEDVFRYIIHWMGF